MARAWLLLLLAGCAEAQLPAEAGAVLFDVSTQQRFLNQLEQSRWNVGQMDYVDGASAAVLRHPYTLAFDEDGSLFVASFTLNHVCGGDV